MRLSVLREGHLAEHLEEEEQCEDLRHEDHDEEGDQLAPRAGVRRHQVDDPRTAMLVWTQR